MGTDTVEKEHIPGYINMALQLMHSPWIGSKFTKGLPGLLKTMSKDRGVYFDAPDSTKEIEGFIKDYNIDMNEFEPSDPRDYGTFNDFFARHLRAGLRPVASKDDDRVIVSPADCRLACFEKLDDVTKVWIKGENYTL